MQSLTVFVLGVILGGTVRDSKNSNLVGRTGDVRRDGLIYLLVTCVGTIALLTWWSSILMPYIVNLRGRLVGCFQSRSPVIFLKVRSTFDKP